MVLPALRLRLCAWRFELGGETRCDDLIQALWPVEPGEPVFAQIAQHDLLADQRSRRFRYQHLTAVRRVADPRRPVDVEADVTLGRHDRLACVHPDPHARLDTIRPGVRQQCPLCRHRPLDSRAR